jgi:hypothetical protein
MEMPKTNHFLEPGGWKITRMDEVCASIFPKEGSTILIGRAKTKAGTYRLAWMDGTECLHILDGLEMKGKRLETRLQRSGYEYVIVVESRGGSEILGKVTGKALQGRSKPPILNMSGTWGAEANPGGGGGKTGLPNQGKDKTTSKPNGNEMALR